MTVQLTTNRILECEGMACPMPIVKTKKAIDDMQAGEVIEVRATDKGSVADLQAWTKRTGQQYVGVKEENGVYRHFIRKSSDQEKLNDIRYPNTVSHEQLEEMLNGGESFILLDVREPAEFVFQHIPGAISVPLDDLESTLSELDPQATYYVICRTGTRSDLACQMLVENGYANVRNVLPGMANWRSNDDA